MVDRTGERHPTARGSDVGLWGRFDLPRLGDLLHPRVFEIELRRRLPGARVHTWSPVGADDPLAVDGGLAPLPLGTATPERLEELASGMDGLVIGGGELIVTRDPFLAEGYGLREGEAGARGLSRFFLESVGERPACPVAWNAAGVPFPFTATEAPRVVRALAPVRYLSVPDEASRQHLTGAGVEAAVAVVPSPLLLSCQVFPSELLGRRLAYLRRIGALPAEGRFFLLEPGETPGRPLLKLLEAVARDLAPRGIGVVVLESATSAAPDGTAAHRLPASASLSDRLAAIAGADGVLSASPGTLLVASSFGTPCGLLDPSGRKLPGFLREPGYAELSIEGVSGTGEAIDRLLARERRTALPGDLASRLEHHFDRLAAVLGPGTRQREEEARTTSWRRAYESISDQLAVQRVRLAERIEAGEAALASALTFRDGSERLQKELSIALGVVEQLTKDLEWSRGDTHRRAEAARALEAQLEEERAARTIAEAAAGAAALARDEASHLAASLATADVTVGLLRQQLGESVASADRLAAELQEARTSNAELEERLAAARGMADASSAALSESEGAVARLTEELERVGARASVLATGLGDAEKARDRLAAEVRSLEASVAAREESLLRSAEEIRELEVRRASAAEEVRALTGSLAASEESVLRATEENRSLDRRLAALRDETHRLRASLETARKQETVRKVRLLEVEEALAQERKRRVEVESATDLLSAELRRHRGDAARLADLEAEARTTSEALAARLRDADEDGSRWRLEADRLLRERDLEGVPERAPGHGSGPLT